MNDMGEVRIRVVAMPKDTNPSGNIFGGWIMSVIDVAGALATRDLCITRVVTVAVNSMEFHEPIFVGDVISCYAAIIKVGTSSIQTRVKVTAERIRDDAHICVHVTSATITYVSVDRDGKKVPIECSAEKRASYRS